MTGSRLMQRAFLAERVLNRVRRVASDVPRARVSSELAFRSERDSYRSRVPGPSADDPLLESLRSEGIAFTSTSELGLDDVVSAAAPLVEEFLAVPTPADLPATHLPADRLRTRPEIFRWGASDRLLDLMERYFEVPVAYHGVYLRRDMAVQRAQASNRWHLDMEDRRVIKLVVYLTDVEDGDGSFQYLPRDQSLELRRGVGSRYHMGPDRNMAQFVPESQWRTANGPAGTVLISDTAILYHKGRRPARRDRVTLFYDYTSRKPVHPFYCKSAVPRAVLEEMVQGMSQRAQDAVFWRPRLKEFDPAKHEG